MLTTEFTRAPDDVPAMGSGPILPFEPGPKKVPCTLPTKLTPIRELETRPWATNRATTYLDCGGDLIATCRGPELVRVGGGGLIGSRTGSENAHRPNIPPWAAERRAGGGAWGGLKCRCSPQAIQDEHPKPGDARQGSADAPDDEPLAGSEVGYIGHSGNFSPHHGQYEIATRSLW